MANGICECSYASTENLILAKPRRVFGAHVRWQHWQLRSLIGIDDQNSVYFPVPNTPDNGSCAIQKLNTKTRETETVKRLSFDPRCIVARNGWVCCGGERGMFCAFWVGEQIRNDGTGPGLALQADDRLPLSFEIPDSAASSTPETRLEKSLEVATTSFGKDRVNCITLWSPPTLFERVDGAYGQDVAILAHNDKTIIVVRLRDQEQLDKITYPDYMNRGVISPDGRLLAGISDDAYLYVHERKRAGFQSASSRYTADSAVGSFAACFSSTGKYLAVGTQYGVVSIFDVATLAGHGVHGLDPLITSFGTTRPCAQYGAVRDMAFSPGSVDLLAWTEDRGRVAVADIRGNFATQQILHLDNDADFEVLPIIDKGTIDPRLLEQRVERSSSLLSTFANAVDSSVEAQTALSHYNIPLTPDETAVLEAVQNFRRRQAHYSTGLNRSGTESSGRGIRNGSFAASNTSTNNRNGGNSDGPTMIGRLPWPARATRGADAGNDTTTQTRNASVSRAVDEILEGIRDHRERIRDSHERLRAQEDSAADRRRYAPASSSLSIPRYARASDAIPIGPGGSRGEFVETSINRPPPPHFASANTRATPGDSFNDPALRGGVSAYTFVQPHTQPEPYDTAGLAWSVDGNTLFVGAENGIYEFHVDTFGRKVFPDVTFS
ncbi:uncharacterized protein C8A04DRAFT_9465 [Dichotomopilus funicola]|uniref:DUF2415 domain-containing protein n=1 Tax=Dichotomopilus funicola TaxID=1934379 RepID=A0AAN6V973_9PEZI|nr:hypothetical protein C8A04DRAFT_9465 [Dichotomopilus funicola]